MQSSCQNDILTIKLGARIDTTNAEEVENEIKNIREENPHTSLILDLQDTTYVSSAGLRVILRTKKAESALSIINVNTEVYEIFDMTGFTEMIDIKKAYRQISVENCEVLGEGSNGIVYRYQPDIIVKVYKNSDALDDIQREREFAKAALVYGINTAIPYDVVKVNDKYGSIFELLSASFLTPQILEHPEKFDQYIKVFMDLLREIHKTEDTKHIFPSAKNTYIKYANFLKEYIPSSAYEKLVALIEAVPESNYMIHGDYHTNNVHFAGDEPILIDMDTLSVGDPVFEFASIYQAYRGFNEIDKNASINFLKMSNELAERIFDASVREYYPIPEDKLAQYISKFRLLCYTRLLRRTIRREPDNTPAIDYLKENLLSLIDSTDSLILD